MSEEDVRRAIEGAEPPIPGDEKKCPITCLGEIGGGAAFVFIAKSGEIRKMTPREMSSAIGILSLFGGDNRWLVETFRAYGKDGKPLDDFHTKKAGAGLMRRCSDAGIFNTDTSLRSVGVWRHVDGGLVVHSGDVLHLLPPPGSKARQRKIKAGCHLGGAIYTAAPPLARPASVPASEEDAAQVLEHLHLWNYADPSSPWLLFGFFSLAMLGAGPQWRVHAFLGGEAQMGKTALMKYIRAGVGGQSRDIVNRFTEPGLRRWLSGEARLVILDEAEGDKEGQARVETVIQLIRHMTGDEGAQSVQAEGAEALRHTVAGQALFAGINPPPLLPQDRSRILEIELRLATGSPAKVEAAIRAVGEMSPVLRARALMGWSRFLDNLAVFRWALGDIGCTSRQQDKFGALLAAAEMMRRDEPIDTEGASGYVVKLAPTLREMMAEAEESGDSAQCVATLLTRPVEWQRGHRVTIGRLFKEALYLTEPGARAALLMHGLKLLVTPIRLFVANQHEGTREIFKGTRWRDGGWRIALGRLDGVTFDKERLDGIQSRGIVLPAKYLPVVDGGEPSPTSPPVPPDDHEPL